MTPNQIASLNPGQELHDKDSTYSVKGLHIRKDQKGRTGFFLHYTTRTGVRRRPKIGDYPMLSISQARQAATALLTIVSSGGDPVLDWRAKRSEKTVSALFDAVFKSHWDKPRFQESGWARECKNLFKKNIEPDLGPKRPTDVTAAVVRSWHASFEERPYAGNRSLEVLSKMFNYAIEQEWLPQGANPCPLIKPFTEKKRTRYATVEELQKIVAILNRQQPKTPEACAFLFTLLLSGSRPRALERATWADLQIVTGSSGQTWGLLSVEGKTSQATGNKEVIILPPAAMQFIDKLPRRVIDQRIFGIKMPKHLWAKIQSEVGCGDLWARDFRRLFATVGLSHGVDLGVVGGLLNHSSQQTTLIYAKLLQTTKMHAANQIAESIQNIISTQESPIDISPAHPPLLPKPTAD